MEETQTPVSDDTAEATHWRLEADVHRRRAAAAVAEIARLRLTDAEREAVALMAEVAADPRGGTVLAGYEVAATLRGLLERMK